MGPVERGDGDRYGSVVSQRVDDAFTAVVSVKSLEPNRTYTVRLIQNADCFRIDGSFTTNAAGNATVRLTEPVASAGYYVAVDGAGFSLRSDRYLG